MSQYQQPAVPIEHIASDQPFQFSPDPDPAQSSLRSPLPIPPLAASPLEGVVDASLILDITDDTLTAGHEPEYLDQATAVQRATIRAGLYASPYVPRRMTIPGGRKR